MIEIFTQNGLIGYKENDKILINAKFLNGYDFKKDVALVKTKKEKWGLIGINGRFIVEPQFKDCIDFTNGISFVKYNKLWGLLDLSGIIIVEPIFELAGPFSEGVARIKFKSKYGYIDKTGNFVIPPTFDFANHFQHGLASVEMNGKCGYIDKTGNFVIEPIYDIALSFTNNGYSIVFKQHEKYYIDIHGKLFKNRPSK